MNKLFKKALILFGFIGFTSFNLINLTSCQKSSFNIKDIFDILNQAENNQHFLKTISLDGHYENEHVRQVIFNTVKEENINRQIIKKDLYLSIFQFLKKTNLKIKNHILTNDQNLISLYYQKKINIELSNLNENIELDEINQSWTIAFTCVLNINFLSTINEFERGDYINYVVHFQEDQYQYLNYQFAENEHEFHGLPYYKNYFDIANQDLIFGIIQSSLWQNQQIAINKEWLQIDKSFLRVLFK